MSTPPTSAIVRSLNEARHLGRLIEGLNSQTVPVDEIVLVDSGSTDGTVDIANDLGCRVVELGKEEFSFGRALNKGCDAASGEILIIMSAHVYPVYDTYIEHMLRPFEEPPVTVAYGRQVGDHRSKYSESRLMLKWFPDESIFDQGHPFCNNANAAVRRSAWDELRYNEELTGLEDLEFAKRTIAAGNRISYVAEAPVVHVHEESWGSIRNRYRREAIAYAQITGADTLGVLETARLAAGNMLSDYSHAAREGQLISNVVDIPVFRLAQFIGAWEGLRSHGQVSERLKRRFYYPGEFTRRPVKEPPGRPIDYKERLR